MSSYDGKIAPPFCERHGTWHRGSCEEIDQLRANATPRVSREQLAFGLPNPVTLCRACGVRVDPDEQFCDACEVSIR